MNVKDKQVKFTLEIDKNDLENLIAALYYFETELCNVSEDTIRQAIGDDEFDGYKNDITDQLNILYELWENT